MKTEDGDLPLCCFDVIDPDQGTGPDILYSAANRRTNDATSSQLSNFEYWTTIESAFFIKATVYVRDGEVFMPNTRDLVADVGAETRKSPYRGPNTKQIEVMGYPYLIARALDKLIYRPPRVFNESSYFARGG